MVALTQVAKSISQRKSVAASVVGDFWASSARTFQWNGRCLAWRWHKDVFRKGAGFHKEQDNAILTCPLRQLYRD